MNSISQKNRKLICQIKSNNLFFFIIIYSLLINPIRLYRIFSAFLSLSGDIILLTDESIELYKTNYKNSKNTIIANTSSNINAEFDRNKISFTNFPNSDNGNFSICSLGPNTFILKDDKCQIDFKIKDFENIYRILIPYHLEGTSVKFILGAIKFNKTIHYGYIYLALYNSNNLEFEKIINYQEETGEKVEINENAISCQYMYFNNSDKQNLICFFQLSTKKIITDKEEYEEGYEDDFEEPIEYLHLSANVFDIENNFKIIDYIINVIAQIIIIL
jgi:hypothetical protein